jgi:hypothetical protein
VGIFTPNIGEVIMPAMSADQIISLTASIGACLAAIATFLTVWQIAKQRRASYRPELVLGSGDFEAKANMHHSGLPNDWRHPEPELVGVTTVSIAPNVFRLPLANIGLGAARNISISWEFAIEDAVANVSKFAKEAGFDEFLTFEHGALKMKSPAVGSVWINQKDETIDYVLPASIPGAVVALGLPNAYMLFVSAAVSLNYSRKTKNLDWKLELLEPPPLSVALSFEDIAGEKHAASFDLYVDIRGTNKYEFAGYVESKRRR